MRISDWSSDVCSSDLRHQRQQQAFAVARPVPLVIEPAEHHADRRLFHTGAEIAQHPVTRLRCQNLPDMLADQGKVVARTDVLADEAIAQIRSEEHTSELQSLMRISYAVFCLKNKTEEHTYATLSPITT